MWKVLSVLVLASLPQVAGAFDFDCPADIRTGQSLSQEVAGWEVFSDTENAHYRLERVRFFYGTPERHADLAPDDEDNQGDSNFWSFVGTEPLWQVCVYGNTSVMLSRPLPKGIKTCKVTYRPKRVMTESDLKIKTRVVCR